MKTVYDADNSVGGVRGLFLCMTSLTKTIKLRQVIDANLVLIIGFMLGNIDDVFDDDDDNFGEGTGESKVSKSSVLQCWVNALMLGQAVK